MVRYLVYSLCGRELNWHIGVVFREELRQEVYLVGKSHILTGAPRLRSLHLLLHFKTAQYNLLYQLIYYLPGVVLELLLHTNLRL